MLQRAQHILRNTYGYSDFRGQQQAVIEAALTGQDALVLMPTGGGKSLCYQIPSIVRDGVGIVVSPLIALMQDQVAALCQLGIKAAFLNSSLNAHQQQQLWQQLRNNDIEILYIAPERLLQSDTLTSLAQSPVSLIAIDEAHCVSQWGHDFRQDYLQLHQLTEHFPTVPRLALTATADERTRQEIIQRLKLNKAKKFISDFDRPNIRYSVQIKTDGRSQLLQFLQTHREEAGIIYCMSRNKVDATAQWLNAQGFTALPYHAGLPNETRASHQTQFLRDEAVIIVATIAFGMGIDKPDVRFVVHMDLPKSLESYYQETGRAGRDGQAAEAWMVYGLQDVVRLRQMSEQSDAAETYKRIERHKLDALLGWCETTSCRRLSLLSYFGETHNKNCGNCDICLQPPASWDATVAAQKLLSCIYRTGQYFGAMHIIDVLRGKHSDKVKQHRHERLSTFGIGEDLNEQQWRSVVRQLLAQSFISADMERYGALSLTEKSRPLLRGEITLSLRVDPDKKSTPRKPPKRRFQNVSNADGKLWDALKACRKRLADIQGVPPYVVFHDATLMAMMENKPNNPNELLQLNGVGQAKLQRYGDEFLKVIHEAAG